MDTVPGVRLEVARSEWDTPCRGPGGNIEKPVGTRAKINTQYLPLYESVYVPSPDDHDSSRMMIGPIISYLCKHAVPVKALQICVRVRQSCVVTSPCSRYARRCSVRAVVCLTGANGAGTGSWLQRTVAVNSSLGVQPGMLTPNFSIPRNCPQPVGTSGSEIGTPGAVFARW